MIKIAGDTHTGRVRSHNEDAFLADAARGLAVVADGMGGHASGEVASRIIIDTFNDRTTGSDLVHTLLAGHSAIVAHAQAYPECSGMGATAVAAQVDAQNCRIAWVGDSRIYLWRPQAGLQQLSRDHSYLEFLLASGEIAPEEARNHPQRNVVTQGLGLNEPQPDSLTLTWQPGDRLLLCSDGLSDELDDAQIAALLAANMDIDAAVAALIEAALDRGGRDNVSVVVAENAAAPADTAGTADSRDDDPRALPADAGTASVPGSDNRWPLWAAIGVAILLGIIVFLLL